MDWLIPAEVRGLGGIIKVWQWDALKDSSINCFSMEVDRLLIRIERLSVSSEQD